MEHTTDVLWTLFPPSPQPKTKKLPPNVLASYRNVLSRYYSRGTHFGMSIASMMFLLAEKLGRSDNAILW